MRQDGQAANTPTTAGEASIVSPDRYAALEAELRQERETTRELVAENRQLWKENGDLRVEVERLHARAAPDDQNSDELRQSA
jgi:regulator of replication initiation timing